MIFEDIKHAMHIRNVVETNLRKASRAENNLDKSYDDRAVSVNFKIGYVENY